MELLITVLLLQTTLLMHLQLQLEILQALAKDDYPALVKVKTKGDQLTQEDVNAYNTAISKVNTELNPATEKINVALQNLLRKNVPKPALRGVKQI